MTDKPQMRQGDNRRMMTEVWHFWAEDKPEDVDGNPCYFDKVAHDLVDINLGDPKSCIGSIFRTFLGNPVKTWQWAEFMVCGVHKTIAETGIASYRLLW